MSKLSVLAVAALVSTALAAPALAGEIKDQCEAYIAENGGDASGCGCLEDAAAGDPALAEGIAAIETPADIDAADAAAKQAIAACFPGSEN